MHICNFIASEININCTKIQFKCDFYYHLSAYIKTHALLEKNHIAKWKNLAQRGPANTNCFSKMDYEEFAKFANNFCCRGFVALWRYEKITTTMNFRDYAKWHFFIPLSWNFFHFIIMEFRHYCTLKTVNRNFAVLSQLFIDVKSLREPSETFPNN